MPETAVNGSKLQPGQIANTAPISARPLKLAVAGKGGTGKTCLSAWLGDYLRRQGRQVWMVDADTAYSLGPALGIPMSALPRPLCEQDELIRQRVGGGGLVNLNPGVDDLPGKLAVNANGLNLLVMGTVAGAGGGCACEASALLKALLAHLFLEQNQCLIVDLEAGVEHLGRGTAAAADGLVIVSDPSLRGLMTAANIAAMAKTLGLTRQALVLNRATDQTRPPDIPELAALPALTATLPHLDSLARRQLDDARVLDLPERDAIDAALARIITALT